VTQTFRRYSRERRGKLCRHTLLDAPDGQPLARETITANARFKNPANAIISMTPEVYSGAFK
jgi:hypothetical protein